MAGKPQQVVRLPFVGGKAIRPGAWVRLKGGKVRRVDGVFTALTDSGPAARVHPWRVSFELLSVSVDWHDVEAVVDGP